MRASEFITEGMTDWQLRAISGMKTIDGANQFYDLYRFGLAMADVGNVNEFTPTGTTEDHPVIVGYTDADEDIINSALKKVSKTATNITGRHNCEPIDTNTLSVVASRKPLPRRK